MSNKLPASVQERIKADADKLYPLFLQADTKAGYIAGATTEAETIQPVIDAAEKVAKLFAHKGDHQACAICQLANALQQWKERAQVDLYICPCCKGDGKETCNNPDHGFIAAIPGDIGRIGCPVCGHDPKHKVKNGGPCEICDGSGKVTIEQFNEFCNETGYDDEPQLTNPPK